MNRRHFLQSLAIGAAALYLRLAPSLVQELPVVGAVTVSEINQIFAAQCQRFQMAIFERIAETNPFAELVR